MVSKWFWTFFQFLAQNQPNNSNKKFDKFLNWDLKKPVLNPGLTLTGILFKRIF